MKNISFKKLLILGIVIFTSKSCINDDSLLTNPNTIAEDGVVPSSLILNNITSNLVKYDEFPFRQAHKYSQFYVSCWSYYWNTSSYNWTNSEDQYGMLMYSNKMEEQSNKMTDENSRNFYSAVSKFFKAYSFIWLTQRVGDIPMSDAGNTNNLKPRYDTQKDVYLACFKLFEESNELLNKIPSNIKNTTKDSGDIYNLTYLQWQKIINSLYIRTLISLSHRANDTPELQVKETFTKILNNQNQYPIQESNSDNMAYVFNTNYNQYPMFNSRLYTSGANISNTVLDMTTATKDPRTFVFASPSPEKYNLENVDPGSFDAYVGASYNTDPSIIYDNNDKLGNTTSDKGPYSYLNFQRYFGSVDGSTAEPYIIFGFSELCFNIAEAINRGWTSGDANQWYSKGINASLDVYGLTDGKKLNIGDRLGTTIGTTIVNINQFLKDSKVVYKGNNQGGLEQILNQKYIGLFCNSGYEAYYSWRRTGYPKFEEGSPAIGTTNNKIPLRWMYPQGEISYNTDHYNQAINDQYGGSDDIFKKMWLIK